MVHPTHVLRSNESPKRGALAYRWHRPVEPAPFDFALKTSRPRPSSRYRLCRINLIAQHELLNLPRGGFRNRAKHHGLRRLEARHLGAAKRDDLGFGYADIFLQFDEGAGHLAPF